MVLFYSNNCPRCEVLKKKLDQAKIPYAVVDDVNKILSKGIDLLPVLEVDGIRMNFAAAVDWVNNRQESANGN